MKKRFTKEKYPDKNFMFIKEAFEYVKFDKKFDVILASYSLHHFNNPKKKLRRIKELLNDNDVFLLIFLEPCEVWNFHLKFRQTSPENSRVTPNGLSFDIEKELMKSFELKKINFHSFISIPFVQDTLNMLDFFLNEEHENIKQETMNKVKKYLTKKHGNEPVTFDVRHGMYVCKVSKKQ